MIAAALMGNAGPDRGSVAKAFEAFKAAAEQEKQHEIITLDEGVLFLCKDNWQRFKGCADPSSCCLVVSFLGDTYVVARPRLVGC